MGRTKGGLVGPHGDVRPGSAQSSGISRSTALSGCCKERNLIVLSRAIYKKQRGRRPLAALAIMSIVAGLLVSSGVALAVHDEDFQLDGNVLDDAAAPQPFDWENFFNSAGAELALPANFTASGFDRDFVTNTNGTYNTSDGSTFATGSKDTLNITPGWQCGYSANVNSKTDISNAYAAEYVDPVTGDEILYFGLERNANTGDGNVGFWFLQDGTVACEATATSGNVAFTGNHQDGDLLVVSEFSNGGAISTINAYEWVGGAGGALDPDAVASGASCATASGGDAICARVNTGTITTPWLTANKQDGAGHSLRVSELFEAGLNLTDFGFGGSCFSTFTGVTRSSTSLTATIFDYSLGTLGDCDSSTVTQAKDGSGANLTSATIPATGTLAVKDTATVDVSGVNTFDATVTFYLCGPSTTLISTCSTSGLQIGSPVAITANGSVDSATAQLTSAGYYCWHAVFSGDGDIPGSADDGTNECFLVNPRQPTLATQATTGPVNFGSKISDTVTLSNTANKPGSGTTIDVARVASPPANHSDGLRTG